MAVLPDALAIKRLLAPNETLRILRTDTLPLICATLSEHLGKPGTKNRNPHEASSLACTRQRCAPSTGCGVKAMLDLSRSAFYGKSLSRHSGQQTRRKSRRQVSHQSHQPRPVKRSIDE